MADEIRETILFFLLSLTLVLLASMPVCGIASPYIGEPLIQANGSLHVDGDPVGMAISLDGEPMGLVPDQGMLILENISTGDHTLTGSKDGYGSKEQVVTVPDGRFAEVRVNLSPVTNGTLEISSSPENVQVYVDEVYRGVTPVSLEDIPAGSHRVLLRLGGYQDWSSPVEVVSGTNVPVSGSLVPVSGSPVATQSGGNAGILTAFMVGTGCICWAFLGRRR
ncbi:MAG: PEGA domain-containing protein [Methanospirillum sp.]|nr:PEGA domain-containing protein [Methanospirillum sp.]